MKCLVENTPLTLRKSLSNLVFLRNILLALIMTITKKNTSYQSRLNLKPTVKCIHLDLDQIYNLSQNPKEKPL